MTDADLVLNIIAGVVGVGMLVYLVIALILPERF